MQDTIQIIQIKLLWGLAILALLAGLIMTGGNLLNARQRTAWIQRKQSDRQAILRMQETMDNLGSALRAYVALEETRLPSLRELLKKAGIAQQADIQEGQDTESLEGWRLRRITVKLKSVELHRISNLLKLAEAARPPWRLVRCRIKAVPKAGAPTGDVDLVLEGLEK